MCKKVCTSENKHQKNTAENNQIPNYKMFICNNFVKRYKMDIIIRSIFKSGILTSMLNSDLLSTSNVQILWDYTQEKYFNCVWNNHKNSYVRQPWSYHFCKLIIELNSCAPKKYFLCHDNTPLTNRSAVQHAKIIRIEKNPYKLLRLTISSSLNNFKLINLENTGKGRIFKFHSTERKLTPAYLQSVNSLEYNILLERRQHLTTPLIVAKTTKTEQTSESHVREQP